MALLHRLFPADAGQGGRHGLECAPVILARNTRAGPEEDIIFRIISIFISLVCALLRFMVVQNSEMERHRSMQRFCPRLLFQLGHFLSDMESREMVRDEILMIESQWGHSLSTMGKVWFAFDHMHRFRSSASGLAHLSDRMALADQGPAVQKLDDNDYCFSVDIVISNT